MLPRGMDWLSCRILVVAFLLIAAVNTGPVSIEDTLRRLAMTHSWWTDAPQVPGNLAAPTSRLDIDHGVPSSSGQRVIFYDPGQSLLMLPADWVGSHLSNLVHAHDAKGLRLWAVSVLMFLPFNFLLVVTCFWLMTLLGYQNRLAALATLVWVSATTVLYYASAPFQNNQVTLFLLLSLALTLRGRLDGRLYWYAAGGLAIGTTVLIRASAVIHVMTGLTFLLLSLRAGSRNRQAMTRILSIWLCAAAVPIMAGRLFDLRRFGHFFETGQSHWIRGLASDPLFRHLPQLAPQFPFQHPFYEGVLGPLFSPAKSIFIYDPLLLPCLITAVLLWKQLPAAVRWVVTCGVLDLGLHLTLTGKLDFWHGDWAWGARYHLASVHLIELALIPAFLLRAFSSTRRVVAVAWVLVILAVTVQVMSVAMPVDVEVAREELEQPVSCDPSNWNSKLHFRLGERAEDLYCLMSASRNPSCPGQAARTAEQRYPQCAEMAHELLRANHLAFFPFNPRHPLFGSQIQFWTWLLLAGAALTGMAFSLRYGIQTLRSRTPEIGAQT